jgi:hypothetical protein
MGSGRSNAADRRQTSRGLTQKWSTIRDIRHSHEFLVRRFVAQNGAHACVFAGHGCRYRRRWSVYL